MLNSIINKKNYKINLFVVLFIGMTASFYILTGLGKLNQLSFVLASRSVTLANIVLKPIYNQLIVQQNSLILNNFRVNVNTGCDGAEVIGIFIFAVLAFPVAFKKKIPAILLGSVSIFILNLVRIITLFLIGLHFNNYMESFHNNILPFLLIVIEFVMWYKWIKWASK